jgi:hypothetical protein
MPKRWRTEAGNSFTWIIEEQRGESWVEICRCDRPFDTEDDAVKEIKELRRAKRRDSQGHDHPD